MGQPKVTLYVDVVSPFAYEAFHILQNEPVFTNVQKTYVPVFLGGLMKACGNTAPINVKNKDKWIQRERIHWAKTFGVPMNETSPASFPPNTLRLQRVLCALALQKEGGRASGQQTQQLLVQSLARLWHAFWVEHAEVANAEVFAPILTDVLGQERYNRVLVEAETVGKTGLKENTDRAFADGAFGLPWMVATDSEGHTEAFWGVDHLGQLLQFLGTEKPGYGNWKSIL